MSRFLSVELVKEIGYRYAQAHLQFDEPMPSFDSRFPGKLETALEAPRRQLGGGFIYKTLAEQASVLFYEMNKIHPFLNGNKRMAVVSLLVFLHFNGCWMHVPWRRMYDIALRVATSSPQDRKKILSILTTVFEKSMTKMEGGN